MAGGRFEKIYLMMIGLSLVMGVFLVWSEDLYSSFDAPAITPNYLSNLTVLNQSAKTASELESIYNMTQSSNWIPFYDILSVGWQVLKLVFGIIGTFLILPMAITSLLIPDPSTASLIGWSLEVCYLGIIVWGLVGLLIRQPEGAV